MSGAFLLQETQLAALPNIFEKATAGIISRCTSTYCKFCIDLQTTAVAPSYLRLYFESIGPVPWNATSNPLWSTILDAVECAWTATKLDHLSLRMSHVAPPVKRLYSRRGAAWASHHTWPLFKLLRSPRGLQAHLVLHLCWLSDFPTRFFLVPRCSSPRC